MHAPGQYLEAGNCRQRQRRRRARGDEEEVDDIGRTVQLGVLFVAKPRPAQPNISARDTERVSCYERDTKNMKMTKKQTRDLQ
jgi:hypothetical protein